MRCFIFKEACLSLSMAFREARIHSLRPKALQTSLRLKQSDPNSLLALSSHTAMIYKLITTYFQEQTASESNVLSLLFFFRLREVYNEDEGRRDKCRGIKKMRKLWEHAEGEIQQATDEGFRQERIQAEEMDHIQKLITACRVLNWSNSRVNKKH